jgi:hypothetical protein
MPAVNDWQQLLADLVTSFWRLRRRAAELERGTPGELSRMRRDLEALADRLADAGVEVLDHTGEPYDAGKSLRVLTFQPTPGRSREEISETLKPSVSYRGQWLQIAEVIVAMPTTQGRSAEPRPNPEEPS